MSKLPLKAFCICLCSNVTATERTDKIEELFERCVKKVELLFPKNSFDRFDLPALRQCIVSTLPNLSPEFVREVEQGLRRGNLKISQPSLTKDEP